ncbi:hypothetical protein G6F70_007534 [Rhizopus microsporus]|nr:hypothetical protein G6F71_008468 [Rhizopus microsporus]KAG1196333.1 hypothetical protein G6F70_007534 [Rhizopus microsporus]KAG1206910.1 hypothetical protein G6F69_008475 [Rhizopus microsporus]KAG1230915.1 hypothetical protein G6F67_006124 [Rhizopus microsporus]KAG1259359.1 hypothetical protein G6F68_008173 [Rhizopus microsporus]
MVRQISKAILVASGVITGLATIAIISYFRQSHERQENSNRLRRSRHIRRRRNNTEEAGRPLSLFKEWGDDDNRNLLNLLHAISENQSRKANPRSALLPSFYPGKLHSKAPLSLEKYKELQNSSHFDQIELEALYEQFKTLSTVDTEEGGIDRETFEQCLGPLGLEKNLITERIFTFFDQDNDGIISFPEIVHGLSILCKGNLDEKIEYAFKGYDLDNDGYISRDELYRMYKSYFYLSMELVRDVVSAMEDEMMDSFEFSASQPVSAAFNVAMPSTSSDRQQSESENDGSIDDNEAGPSTKKRKYPLKEDHFLKQYALEAEQARVIANASEAQVDDMTADALRTDSQKLLLSRDDLKNKQKNGKKVWEEKFPIMETMTQGAINEMVDKTFKSIKTERDGYINFEEFKQCVQTDSSIVSWFEALGTVF